MDYLSLWTPVHPVAICRRSAVREMFRLRRLATAQHRLWFFYLEHSLLEQASNARLEMLVLLRRACQQWRLILDAS